jgi:hypothetical protein
MKEMPLKISKNCDLMTFCPNLGQKQQYIIVETSEICLEENANSILYITKQTPKVKIHAKKVRIIIINNTSSSVEIVGDCEKLTLIGHNIRTEECFLLYLDMWRIVV